MWMRPFLYNDTDPFLNAGFSGMLKKSATVYRIKESSNVVFKVNYVCFRPTVKFPVPWKMTKFSDIVFYVFKLGRDLKAFTDLSNQEARVASFDPQCQTGGSANFFNTF